MLIRLLPAVVLLAWGLAPAAAQTSAPTSTPTSLAFTYQINSATMPAAKTLQIAVPTVLASSTLTITSDAASQWLTVTPDTGRAPLTLTVTVNPTSLTPGSFAGWVKISAAAANQLIVPVTLAITSPPSALSISSSSANYTSTGTPTSFAFSFVTGDAAPAPASSQLNIASTGDTVSFTATAVSTGSWLRISVQGQLASLKTSGVALSGSYVPLIVTLDSVALATLSPGSYTGTVTIAGNNTVTVAVNLVVSAGAPTVTGIWPSAVVMGTTVPPTLTIIGDNFFSTSVVTMTAVTPTLPATMPAGVPTTAQMIPTTLGSRKILRAVIPVALLQWQLTWNVKITNPAPPNNPGQLPASAPDFTVVSATTPLITSITNAASYLSTSIFTGSTAANNPLPSGGTSVAPREIISIFGQNLGPSTAVIATASATTPAVFSNTALNNIKVEFTINGTTVDAPLIMVSANQVNAIVPVAVSTAPGVTIAVVNTLTGEATAGWLATTVSADPGVFTFGGLGKGQAAVLNYDTSTNTTVVNSTKDTASKGSAIEIFATGLGDYDSSTYTMVDGEVPTAVINTLATTIRVDIDGQPAVVTYAGTSPGAVAGLVQVNAIVPPTVRTGTAIPLTVSWGPADSSRRSQAAVTIGVK
jgi:uncharacterized protein (TIGR03437 family)